MRRSSSCSSEKAKFMGSLRVVRMRPPGRWAVTFYRAFRTSARRSVYARVRSLSMEQIGARELRANLAAALRQAGAGERVVVTVDGRPVAQLGPLEPSGTPSLAELAASGLVEPPRRPDRPVDRKSTRLNSSH